MAHSRERIRETSARLLVRFLGELVWRAKVGGRFVGHIMPAGLAGSPEKLAEGRGVLELLMHEVLQEMRHLGLTEMVL